MIKFNIKALLAGILLVAATNVVAMDVENNESLVKAARDGKTDRVRELIRKGADLNYEMPLNAWTPLIAAANYAQAETIKILLEAGANPNYLASNGNDTALISASGLSLENIDGLIALLAGGADIYQKTKGGNTALVNAVTYHNINAAKALLSAVATLTPAEKESVKTWLFANEMCRKKGASYLPKDMRIFVAQNIYHSLAEALRERVIRAGALNAQKVIKEKSTSPWTSARERGDLAEPAALLESYLDLNTLAKHVRAQITKLKRLKLPTTEGISHEEAFGTFEPREEEEL
jgi:ankyrin repeat protein